MFGKDLRVCVPRAAEEPRVFHHGHPHDRARHWCVHGYLQRDKRGPAPAVTYKDPGRLVVIGSDLRTRSIFDERMSFENYADLRSAASSVFEDATSVATFRVVSPREDGTPEQVVDALVPTNFFRVLGAHIVAGRDFDDADGQPAPPPDPTAGAAQQPPPLPTMAIVSYEYWQRRFGGSTAIFGHPLQNGRRTAPLS